MAPTRTLANAVIIEAFFALLWFSWGQARPPAWESIALTVGAILAVVVVTGLGAGACLLGHAASLLVIAARRQPTDELDSA